MTDTTTLEVDRNEIQVGDRLIFEARQFTVQATEHKGGIDGFTVDTDHGTLVLTGSTYTVERQSQSLFRRMMARLGGAS